MTTGDQELYEFSTHAFVIKIWLEDDLHWRGHITHVPSGERKYFEELGEVKKFIIPYLEQMGIHSKTLDYLHSLLRCKHPKRKMIRAFHQHQGKTGGDQP